jgi:hypothetical protein
VGVAVPLKANATAWFYVATFVTQVELIPSKRLRKRFDEHFHLFFSEEAPSLCSILI